MALLNLTRLKSEPSLYLAPFSDELLATHEEIECMLETILLDLNNLESQLSSMQVQIESAEDLISLRLGMPVYF